MFEKSRIFAPSEMTDPVIPRGSKTTPPLLQNLRMEIEKSTSIFYLPYSLRNFLMKSFCMIKLRLMEITLLPLKISTSVA